jgi:hypothetical protein
MSEMEAKINELRIENESLKKEFDDIKLELSQPNWEDMENKPLHEQVACLLCEKIKIESFISSIKCSLFEMWSRVESGQFGDIALNLRNTIYEQNEELFFKEYEKYKK